MNDDKPNHDPHRLPVNFKAPAKKKKKRTIVNEDEPVDSPKATAGNQDTTREPLDLERH